MDSKEITKRIVEGEMKLFHFIKQGGKPYYGDEMEPVRTEVEVLRCLYYGKDSKHCNPRYRK